MLSQLAIIRRLGIAIIYVLNAIKSIINGSDMLQLTMTRPRKNIDFLMRTVQKAFCDVSVVISGNKPQMESAIFKLSYYLIKVNNKK